MNLSKIKSSDCEQDHIQAVAPAQVRSGSNIKIKHCVESHHHLLGLAVPEGLPLEPNGVLHLKRTAKSQHARAKQTMARYQKVSMVPFASSYSDSV